MRRYGIVAVLLHFGHIHVCVCIQRVGVLKFGPVATGPAGSQFNLLGLDSVLTWAGQHIWIMHIWHYVHYQTLNFVVTVEYASYQGEREQAKHGISVVMSSQWIEVEEICISALWVVHNCRKKYEVGKREQGCMISVKVGNILSPDLSGMQG